MPKWKKWVRAALGIGGTALGATIALSPTFRGIQVMVGGNPVGGADAIVADLTGMSILQNDFTPDFGKILGVGVAVGVGVGIMSIFKFFARRI